MSVPHVRRDLFSFLSPTKPSTIPHEVHSTKDSANNEAQNAYVQRLYTDSIKYIDIYIDIVIIRHRSQWLDVRCDSTGFAGGTTMTLVLTAVTLTSDELLMTAFATIASANAVEPPLD